MNTSLKIFAILAIFSSYSTNAQNEIRSIPSNPSLKWQHTPSGIAIPATFIHQPRQDIQSVTSTENNIWAHFYSSTDSDLISLYIFWSAIPESSIWHDRAQHALENNKVLNIDANTPRIQKKFSASNHSNLSGLQTVYDLPTGAKYRSIGLATMAVGHWVLKVRISSLSNSAEKLSEQLYNFPSDLIFPDATTTATPANFMAPCDSPLRANPAKLHAPNVTSAMIDSVTWMGIFYNPAASQDNKYKDHDFVKTKKNYCRDSSSQTESVYKLNAKSDDYIIAFSDAGSVAVPLKNVDISSGEPAWTYSVSHSTSDATHHYQRFNRLPTPAQTIQLIQTRPPISQTELDQTLTFLTDPRK